MQPLLFLRNTGHPNFPTMHHCRLLFTVASTVLAALIVTEAHAQGIGRLVAGPPLSPTDEAESLRRPGRGDPCRWNEGRPPIPRGCAHLPRAQRSCWQYALLRCADSRWLHTPRRRARILRRKAGATLDCRAGRGGHIGPSGSLETAVRTCERFQKLTC
jgi:hypothetical protein